MTAITRVFLSIALAFGAILLHSLVYLAGVILFCIVSSSSVGAKYFMYILFALALGYCVTLILREGVDILCKRDDIVSYAKLNSAYYEKSVSFRYDLVQITLSLGVSILVSVSIIHTTYIPALSRLLIDSTVLHIIMIVLASVFTLASFIKSVKDGVMQVYCGKCLGEEKMITRVDI